MTRLRVVERRPVERLTPTDLPAPPLHALTNRLYGAGGIRANGLAWFWRAMRAQQSSEWVTLGADDARLHIALEGDAVGLEGPAFDWRRCQGETRLLAWAAHHESFIELLRVVFQRDWIPETIGARNAVQRAGRVKAGFSVHRADGTRVVTGVADFCASAVAAASGQGGACERPGSLLDGVRAELPCIIDEFGVDAQSLTALEPGCIVRLDNRSLAAGKARVVSPAGAVHLVLELAGARATVIGFAGASTHSVGGHFMSSDQPAAGAGPADTQPGAPGPAAIDPRSVPVRLAFSAGRLSVAISELRNVAPGYVFELDKRLDDQMITVFANDTPVALGELVAIGDLIGVRITRIIGAS
jgi:flagellar motor switch/type III secretory pathway protein FliN